VFPSFDGARQVVSVAVTDASGVSSARRHAAALTRTAGFGEVEAGRLAIVVTEAASNLLKHGAGGEILLQAVAHESVGGIEILALDRGRGIPSVAEALRDGYSTAGSPGTGLGAMKRQADECDIYSLPGQGTVVLARVWAGPVSRGATDGLSVGTAWAPRPGEEISGDGWMVMRRKGRLLILVVDGLGHGPLAADARAEAVRIFGASRGDGPVAAVEAIHAGLRSTRGAAVAVSEIDPERGSLRYCGLGNIAAVILTDGHARHLVSHNGTAGHAARKIDEFTYPWAPGATLVQHTDGLSTHWSLEAYPGLITREPGLLAGVLYRDFKRGRDDVAVVVARGAAA
jgi:anti-sigma regulatory factor (Ser/Thr protein kinase)